MELPIVINNQFFNEQFEIKQFFSSKLNIDLSLCGLGVISARLYNKNINILHQGFNHVIGDINDRYIIKLYDKNHSEYDDVSMYIVIKPEELAISGKIVKKMTKYLNNLDTSIYVYKFDGNKLIIGNTVKTVLYTPLESKYYKDFVRRFEIIKSYDSTGVTFNTNMLLTGPPGSGKTRFVMDIAVHLKYSIYNLSLSKNDIKSAESYSKCIYMIEEIDKEMTHDGAFIDPLRIDESQLLCFLDGNIRSSDTILIMTCNDFERVKRNKIFSRKGRINQIYEFGGITIEQCRHLINLYYNNGRGRVNQDVDITDEQIQQFYDGLPKKSATTIAMLSAYIQESILNEVPFADLDPKLVFIDESSRSSLYQ